MPRIKHTIFNQVKANLPNSAYSLSLAHSEYKVGDTVKLKEYMSQLARDVSCPVGKIIGFRTHTDGDKQIIVHFPSSSFVGISRVSGVVICEEGDWELVCQE